MRASGRGWCEGRRLGAPSIFAGESLHEYPGAAADRAGMLVSRGALSLLAARLLSWVVRRWGLMLSAGGVAMAVDPVALAELTAKMRQLGLPDPERAARAELETGAPILATQSFLKWLADG